MIVGLDDTDERDRAAFFAYARAVAISGAGLSFVPEVVEAWAYGKPVLASEDAIGAAALVRETGGGIVVARGGWAQAIAALPGDDALGALARAGASYADARGGWRRVAARTSEAIDGLAALRTGVRATRCWRTWRTCIPLVQRQRRTIEAMRVSRFWRLRDAWFAVKRRFGIGPVEDPVRVAERDARAVEARGARRSVPAFPRAPSRARRGRRAHARDDALPAGAGRVRPGDRCARTRDRGRRADAALPARPERTRRWSARRLLGVPSDDDAAEPARAGGGGPAHRDRRTRRRPLRRRRRRRSARSVRPPRAARAVRADAGAAGRRRRRVLRRGPHRRARRPARSVVQAGLVARDCCSPATTPAASA